MQHEQVSQIDANGWRLLAATTRQLAQTVDASLRVKAILLTIADSYDTLAETGGRPQHALAGQPFPT